MDDSSDLLRQLKAQFEAHDEATRASLDRMRSVMYRNKKELEAPIFQNKIRLEKMRKKSFWLIVLVVLQASLLAWLFVTNNDLKSQVGVLNQATHDFEVNTAKQIQKVESDVTHLRRERRR